MVLHATAVQGRPCHPDLRLAHTGARVKYLSAVTEGRGVPLCLRSTSVLHPKRREERMRRSGPRLNIRRSTRDWRFIGRMAGRHYRRGRIRRPATPGLWETRLRSQRAILHAASFLERSPDAMSSYTLRTLIAVSYSSRLPVYPPDIRIAAIPTMALTVYRPGADAPQKSASSPPICTSASRTWDAQSRCHLHAALPSQHQ